MRSLEQKSNLRHVVSVLIQGQNRDCSVSKEAVSSTGKLPDSGYPHLLHTYPWRERNRSFHDIFISTGIRHCTILWSFRVKTLGLDVKEHGLEGADVY